MIPQPCHDHEVQNCETVSMLKSCNACPVSACLYAIGGISQNCQHELIQIHTCSYQLAKVTLYWVIAVLGRFCMPERRLVKLT